MRDRWRASGAMAALLLGGTMVPLPAAAAGPGSAPGLTRAPAIRCARWINSPPLRPEDLEGKVVVVEFWTFDCINCLRTVPAMKALRAALPESEVVILGVHTPELDRERDVENVRRAVKRLGVSYPVPIDGEYVVWKAFGNHYWPALYVIDRRGFIRGTHVGELHQGTPAWDEVTALIGRLRREPA